MSNNIKEHSNILSKKLDGVFNDVSNEKFKEILEYTTNNKGKMIRPLLLTTLLEALEVDYKDYLNSAIAIELIHLHSLIFDDLPCMDNDDYRRGKLTTHKKYDEASAVLAGLDILTTAFDLINKSDHNAELKIELSNILINANNHNGIIIGQFLDLSESFTNSDEILNMYNYKTGKLIAAPIVMAEVISGKKLIGVEKFIKELGIIFQIQDDVLEVTKTFEEIGKSIKSDEINNKITYIKLNGMEQTIMEINEYFNNIEIFLSVNNLKNSSFEELILKIKNREW